MAFIMLQHWSVPMLYYINKRLKSCVVFKSFYVEGKKNGFEK